MPTIAELLAEPTLRLRLAAGRDGLDNAVLAAHTSELTEVSPWLQGGELLMTVGLFLPADLDGCRRYVADCLRGGTSGLVLGLGDGLPHQDAPAALVTAAEERQLPVLLLPDPIPFIAVTKWVFARLAEAERREWQDAVEITRALTAAAGAAEPLDAVLRTWAQSMGTSVAVTDLGGQPLATAGPDADALVASSERVVGEAAAAPGPVRDIPGEADVQVLVLGASTPRGRLLLRRSADARARHALAVLVSLLSLELDHRYAYGNPERMRHAHAVGQLISSGLRPELARRLAGSIGLPEEPLRVVVVRTAPGERSEDLASVIMSSVRGAVGRARTGAVDLLVPDLVGLLPALEWAAPGRPIGVSALSRLADLHVSAQQANSLSQVSAHLGHPVQAEESGATALLLRLGPPELLASYANAVLAPLEAADGRERGDLLHTLDEWLRANGAWEPAAAALSVHRNTVRNRIARVAELLGRSLDSADVRMELWLALQARVAVLRRDPAAAGDDPAPDRSPDDAARAAHRPVTSTAAATSSSPRPTDRR